MISGKIFGFTTTHKCGHWWPKTTQASPVTHTECVSVGNNNLQLGFFSCNHDGDLPSSRFSTSFHTAPTLVLSLYIYVVFITLLNVPTPNYVYPYHTKPYSPVSLDKLAT